MVALTSSAVNKRCTSPAEQLLKRAIACFGGPRRLAVLERIVIAFWRTGACAAMHAAAALAGKGRRLTRRAMPGLRRATRACLHRKRIALVIAHEEERGAATLPTMA